MSLGVHSLFSRQCVFKTVNISDLKTKANVVGGFFPCTLENYGNIKEQPKARYIAHGYKDQEKPFIVRNLFTVRQTSTEIIYPTVETLGIRILVMI